jgi:hypothetical protein
VIYSFLYNIQFQRKYTRHLHSFGDITLRQCTSVRRFEWTYLFQNVRHQSLETNHPVLRPRQTNSDLTCTTAKDNKTGKLRITWHWNTYLQPLLLWKSNIYYILWVCVCSLRYPACKANAPYCHLWPVRLYNIFSHQLINGTIFGWGELQDIKWVFWFSLKRLSETLLILRRNEREKSKLYTGLHAKCPLL